MTQLTATDDTAAALQTVRRIAAKAGCELFPHPISNILMVKCEMGGGRTQTVYIEYKGRTIGGFDCVTFMSPCKVVEKNDTTGGIRPERAMDLLRRNARLNFGCFALESFDGQNDVLMAFSSQIIDTMDVDGFRVHITAAAELADGFESECGRDVS